MKLLRSFPFLAYLLMLVSITGYCVAQRSLLLLLVVGTMALVSWFVTEGPRGKTLPAWATHVLVLGVSLFVVADWYQHQADWMGVLGRYSIWLAVIKLYERKMPRDYAQLFAFSLLLMVMGCLLSADLLFSVVLLVYAVLVLYTLLLHQLHGAFEGEKQRRANVMPRGYRLAPSLKPVFGSRVGVHFRVFAIMVGVIGFLISLILFLVFPRGTGEDILPGLPSATQRRTQFLDQINLGGGTRITQSRRPLFRVAITDDAGRTLHDVPYLIRGGVLDQYVGHGQWRATKGKTFPIGTLPDEESNLAANLDALSGVVWQRFTLNAPLDVLPSLAAPVSVKMPAVIAVQYDPVAQMIIKPDHVGRLPSFEIGALRRPTLTEATSLLRGESFRWDRTWRYRNSQVRDFARQMLSSAGLPASRPSDAREAWRWNQFVADRFRGFLSSGEFVYDLDLSDIAAPGPDDDPIEQFLFATKRGHCEYFASAMAALCHTVGVQARVVTGFVAYEFDSAGQEYVISESNAHAWVEVRTGNSLWGTFDPTPPIVLAALHDVQPSIPDRIGRIMSGLESGLGDRILNFDEQSQQDLTRLFDLGWSDRLEAIWQVARNWMRGVNQYFNLGAAGYVWMGIVATALIIAVIALVKLVRRSLLLRKTLKLHHLRGPEYQRMLRQLGFYLDMLYVLRKGGHAKPDWQPPSQFADAFGLTHPEAATCVQDITRVFYAARYGGKDLSKADRTEARTQLEQLATLLKVRL